MSDPWSETSIVYMFQFRTTVSALLFIGLSSATVAPAAQSGHLYDQVVSALERWYYDKEFRAQELPKLAAEFRDRAHGSEDAKAERGVIKELLARIPSSHLALISLETYRRIGAELSSKAVPTIGLQLIKLDGHYHATWVYEGGPAELAGVKRGDEVLSLDGLPPGASPLLDWSTDDAALPDAEIHDVLVDEGGQVELKLLRAVDEELSVTIEVQPYCGAQAAEASVRIIERDGLRLGYVHFWYIPFDTPSALLERVLTEDFADCDGLVLDLRGRGGSGAEVMRLKTLLDPENGKWRRPLVALIDGATRSAKEVIALEIKQRKVGLVVGERTAGAVIPASFRKLSGGAVLMFPWMTIGKYTDQIEGKGVAPDVDVADHLAYTAGADPILVAGIERLVETCAIVAAAR